jgi:hypothetical protein
LSARFRVTRAPRRTVSVEVRGQATAGAQTLVWTATVSVAPSDTQATITATSAVALPNTVACYEALTITWTATSRGIVARPAGSSVHLSYVVLSAPVDTPIYWTLLDISCRASGGAIDELGVIARSFARFQGRSLTRKRDGHPLTYQNPPTMNCATAGELLEHADGNGECGAWAELLIDMYKVHGITSVDKIAVSVGGAFKSKASGFMVKHWQFDNPPPTSPTTFTHTDSNCRHVAGAGIPGQGNPHPPALFETHFIVRAAGQFFDPSYGTGPFATARDWEAASIDGLYRGPPFGGLLEGLYEDTAPRYGFHNSPTALLDFRNATRGGPI